MIPKNLIKPLELVVSAIHCLREEKGSSAQTIMRYLLGKYNVNIEMLRPQVQVGLKRGLNFGLLTQDCGLYRLNDVLSAPVEHQPELGSGDCIEMKAKKKSKSGWKRRFKNQRCNRKRTLIKRCLRLRRSKRKPKLTKRKRQKTKQIFTGSGTRRNEIKSQTQRRQKNKNETVQLLNAEKAKTEPVKTEPAQTQRPTVSTKEQEREKLMKT